MSSFKNLIGLCQENLILKSTLSSLAIFLTLKKWWKTFFTSHEMLLCSRHNHFFEIYDITNCLANNCNTHLSNISRSKANQTLKFGQLVENLKWKTFFLKHPTQNVVEKLFPLPFLKNQNWTYLWSNSLTIYIVCF